MKYTLARDGNTATLLLQEDIIDSSLASFAQELLRLIQGGVSEIVLDMANVAMVDSRGIGTLIATHNQLKDSGHLVLRNVSGDIHKMLRLMRLDQHFRVEPA